MIRALWSGLGFAARVGLVAGAAAIVALTIVLAWWLLRADYQILFAELSPQDASMMGAELDRLKIPFTVSEDGGGSTIRVEKADVYRTRLKLMGKDLPLHGAVGFELFNSSDFGMTEFAQKINYQRALQGELTRTILSLAEVRDVRVLLALPEQGLFKHAASRAKASITVTMKHGLALRPEQVTGVQRLVAAAVPGIAAQDVTIVDQSGIALTRAADDGEVASGRLELKRETEAYLARKATQVLERALGAGQALASVDVTLDMDRVQTTTEEVVGAPGRSGQAVTGVVVRERETQRQVGAPLGEDAAERRTGTLGGSAQREVDYATGRRVEQVMRQPGTLRRIQVVAVVKTPLDPAQLEQLRATVAASVGAAPDRGDSIVIQPMSGLAPVAAPAAGSKGAPAAVARGEDTAGGGAARSAEPFAVARSVVLALAAAAAALTVIAAWALRRRSTPDGTADAPRLTDAQRQAALARVRAWMRSGDASRSRGATP